MARLGDIATYVNGYAFKPSDWSDIGIPIIRIQDLTGNSYQANRYNGEYDKRYEIHDGDVLISWSASLGVYVWTGEKAVLNQHIFKVVFNKVEVDKSFFVHQVRNMLENAASQAHGATMKHLTKPVFDALPFNLPSVVEQQRISSVLDKLTNLISLRKQQLAKLDELVKARFVEMFGDPMRNPSEWPIHQLQEYILFLTSGSRGWAQYFTNSGEYFITIKNVKNCRVTLDDVQYVIPPNDAEAKRTKVEEGDLLISITADLGRTGVITKEIADYGAYINQHLTCIRLDRKALHPLYVAYYMESEAGKIQFRLKNQNGVKAGLNFNAINSLNLMVPPLERQNYFVDFVAKMERQKLTIQQSLDKLEVLRKSLMQEYFG
jgi:type I restriction enzyme S subunit